VISLAVALWLNRLSNPFVEKGKSVEPIPKVAPAQPPPPPAAAKAAEQAAKGKAAPEKPAEKAAKSSERPRFEFYQILPGEKDAGDKDAKAAAKAPPVGHPEAAKPGSSPATPKPHTGETYWLQAGAFAEEKEADNLKAKIALTGLEAAVRAVSIPDKGMLYRVRLGPYQSLDDANRIKSALSENGVGAAIIRTTEDSKNP
jgi:cell division protein FtsN